MHGIAEVVLSLVTPTLMFSTVALIGLFIGRIRIGKVFLGFAAVLATATLLGFMFGRLSLKPIGGYVEAVNRLKESCQVMSTFGTALFISVLSVCAGKAFAESNVARWWKAFAGGAVTVCAGAICIVVISAVSDLLPRELVLGAFAGGMTSTPTLALVSEFVEDKTLSTLGYSIAYAFGLSCVVFLVQLTGGGAARNSISEEDRPAPELVSDKRGLIAILLVITTGTILGNLLSIGASGGMLLCGGGVGYLFKKRNIPLPSMESLREMGLLMFFVGSGIPAGLQMVRGIDCAAVAIGITVPLVAIAAGSCFAKKVLSFSKTDILTVVCGGMTSSPAFSLLQERYMHVDATLYSASYVGALVALFFCARLLIVFL